MESRRFSAASRSGGQDDAVGDANEPFKLLQVVVQHSQIGQGELHGRTVQQPQGDAFPKDRRDDGDSDVHFSP